MTDNNEMCMIGEPSSELRSGIVELPQAAIVPKRWRVNPVTLYPPFVDKLAKALDAAEKRGAAYFVISGYRSAEEQAKLYAQGRTKPGRIVTNARAWQSYHQFHAAADMCRDADVAREGLQPDWQLEAYRILAECAKDVGLESAFYWKSFREGPHVQLPFDRMRLSKDALKTAYLAGGQKALYALLDKYRW